LGWSVRWGDRGGGSGDCKCPCKCWGRRRCGRRCCARCASGRSCSSCCSGGRDCACCRCGGCGTGGQRVDSGKRIELTICIRYACQRITDEVVDGCADGYIYADCPIAKACIDKDIAHFP